MAESTIRVLHVVYSLYAGGCERLLGDILRHSDSSRFSHRVLSLSQAGERIARIQQTMGIPYSTVDMQSDPQQLMAQTREFQPHVIQTWLPQANIAGGLVGHALNIPVLWGIHSALPPDQLPAEKTTIERQLHLSSYVPRHIVCCSEAVRQLCLRMGFKPELLLTITNGTDTRMFSFRPEGRRNLRREFDIDEHASVIGMAAEYAPTKGHSRFLQAARLLLSAHPDARFLLCGKNIDTSNTALSAEIHHLGLADHVRLLGIRDDMPDFYSALDIHTLNSVNESFGLATSEAMACQTLCVATDVGISKDIVGKAGRIIPASHDPETLAGAWRFLLALPSDEKRRLGEMGRERIKQYYSITETAKNYDALYHTSTIRESGIAKP